jgi:hypothetical protein
MKRFYGLSKRTRYSVILALVTIVVAFLLFVVPAFGQQFVTPQMLDVKDLSGVMRVVDSDPAGNACTLASNPVARAYHSAGTWKIYTCQSSVWTLIVQTAAQFLSTSADPADQGVFRMGTGQCVAWEQSPTADPDITVCGGADFLSMNNFGSLVLTGATGGDPPELRFEEDPDIGNQWFSLRAASSMDSNDPYVWPSDYPGSSAKLTSDASGTLSWDTSSGGGGGFGYETVEDEGTPLTDRATLDCVGGGVLCFDNAPDTVISIPGLDIKDEGVSVVGASDTPDFLDFVGAGVTCTGIHPDVTCTIPGGASFTDIDNDYGDQTVISSWNFIDNGTGANGSYDATFGDVTTPDYGAIQIGRTGIYSSSFSTGNVDLGGALVFRQEANIDVGNDPGIEFAWLEQGNTVRMAIPESGAGNATAMIRSVTIAGPYNATIGNDAVTCNQWTNDDTIIDCDTSGTGADLFVQDDVMLEGTLYFGDATQSTGLSSCIEALDDDVSATAFCFDHGEERFQADAGLSIAAATPFLGMDDTDITGIEQSWVVLVNDATASNEDTGVSYTNLAGGSSQTSVTMGFDSSSQPYFAWYDFASAANGASSTYISGTGLQSTLAGAGTFTFLKDIDINLDGGVLSIDAFTITDNDTELTVAGGDLEVSAGDIIVSDCVQMGGILWCDGSGAPASTACDAAAELGDLYSRTDSQTNGTYLYVCEDDGAGGYQWTAAHS